MTGVAIKRELDVLGVPKTEYKNLRVLLYLEVLFGWKLETS
jgi:hypothetical protein